MVKSGKALYRTTDEEYEVDYIAMELAENGELFEFIAQSGPFDEKYARFYIKQAFKALYYCHNVGYAHRDLKPENIFLDKDFNLLLADFGFAGPIEGREGDGNLTTRLGSKTYRAPEILAGQPYAGA